MKKTCTISFIFIVSILLLISCTPTNNENKNGSPNNSATETIEYLKEVDYVPAYPNLTLVDLQKTEKDLTIAIYDSKEKDTSEFMNNYKDLMLKDKWNEETNSDENQLDFTKENHTVILSFNQTKSDEYIQITVIAK